jgi:hypothetical protein
MPNPIKDPLSDQGARPARPASDRVFDRSTGRSYKKGYSPSEIRAEVYAATCGLCGGPALLFPDGLLCERCTPPARAAALRASLGR